MTDKEIKTGLRYCFSIGYSNCKGCPYFNTQKGKRCANALFDDAIGLINRQQEEIDHLKNPNKLTLYIEERFAKILTKHAKITNEQDTNKNIKE